MKEFLSGNGEASSKRLFLFMLMCQYLLYINMNLFFKFTLKQTIEDSLFYLILAMFVGVGLEKWPLQFSSLFSKTVIPTK